MATFKLPFPPKETQHWAGKYSYREDDAKPIKIGHAARRAGFLTRADFLVIARWKSRRPGTRHEQNNEDIVREVTRFAFSTPIERLRLDALTLLSGVAERTASALLHFCHRDRYPLMDERAFGALGVVKAPADWSAVWLEYTKECRKIADRAGVDMRTLDKALWAYSLEKRLVAR